MRRHRLAERFLTDMLGLSWAEAHKEAGKWEHVISDDVEAAIDRASSATRRPARTATRSPAPTTTRPTRCRSATSPVGAGFTVSRIPEELEFTPGLLEFLEGAGSARAQRHDHGGVARRHHDRRDRRPATWASAPFAAARILVASELSGASST